MIVYYITSHGYGHAVRACEIIRNLPPDVPLTIRSEVPEAFLRGELRGRSFTLEAASFDCGTLGPDSQTIDLRVTIEAAEEVLAANEARLAGEAAFLEALGTRLVVSDVPAFALRAADAAGIPSILTANFTWSSLYRHLLEQQGGPGDLRERAGRVIRQMDSEYALGGLLLETDMSVPMTACRHRCKVPLVVRRGRDRRQALIDGLGLDPARPIVMVYFGREGMHGIRWDRAAELGDLQLVGFHKPAGAGDFVHVVPEALIEHADLAASVDAVVAKPGYGVCGECIASSTPLLYLPRPDFYEMEAVTEVMERWGGGLCMPVEDFKTLRWRPWIERVHACELHPERVPGNGGPVIAAVIARSWREGRLPAEPVQTVI